MCSTLEQIENFLRSPPSDCLNLSTNNGLDLSCSSSYYNEECLNLSSKSGSYSTKPEDLSLQHHHQEQPTQQQSNEIVNLSTNDSRNYYYQGRQDEHFYTTNNSGYDRNSPLNLERRSSPLNLTFPQTPTSSKPRGNNQISNYDYGNSSATPPYYPLQQQQPCEYPSVSLDYSNYPSYPSNSTTHHQNQMYINYTPSNNNNNAAYYSHPIQQTNEAAVSTFFSCPQCGASFRDLPSQEAHIKHAHPQMEKTLWNHHQQQYDQYNLPTDHSELNSLSSMPQNYATRQMSYELPVLDNNTITPLNEPVQVQNIQAPTSAVAPCSVCQMTFSSAEELKKHMELTQHTTTNNNNNYPDKAALFLCATCLKEFSSTTALSAHVQEHKSEKPHKCDKCPQVFRNHSGLKRHLNRVHGKEKQGFKCETCGKGFYERHDLLRHAKIHSLPKCGDCGKSIKNNNHDCKKKHHQPPSNPSKKLAYPCRICSDSLDSKISWGYHMWKHTKDPSYIITSEDADIEGLIPLQSSVNSNPPNALGGGQPLCLQKRGFL